MPETHVYLIRHGATAANDARPYVLQGCGVDHPLSETGRKQANAVGEFLAGARIDRICCSRLQRTFETGVVIGQHHNLEPDAVDGLHEVDVGDWEGMDWDRVMREYPEDYRAFMDRPGEHPYTGGESYADVLNRVKPAIRRIVDDHPDQKVVIVAHQVVNRSYLADLLGIPLNQARAIRQANTGINVIRYRPNETEVITLNACFHLNSL